MGVKIGLKFINITIGRTGRNLNDFAKQTRISNREERATLHDFFEEKEGVLYNPEKGFPGRTKLYYTG